MRLIFLLMGAPCSGKSDIGRELSKIYNIPYISSGDIARDMGNKDEKIKNDLISGKMAPEEFMRSAVLDKINNEHHMILDGFPRFIDQHMWLLSNMNNTELVPIVINSDYNTLLSRSRLRSREDDNSFSVRMQYYIENTLPLIEEFGTQAMKFDNNSCILSVVEVIVDTIDRLYKNKLLEE